VPTHLLAVLILGGVLASGLALLPRRIRTTRSVLIHAGRSSVWESVRLFPAWHARHSKFRSFASIECCILKNGDGEEAGSLWRLYGRIGRTPYWADLRVVEVEPGCRVVLALDSDRLGTERQVRDHRARLDLEVVHPGLTKTTWNLEARLTGTWARVRALWNRPRLQALLLDQGLRSLKVHVEKSVRTGAAAPATASPGAGHPRPPVESLPSRDPRLPLNPS
jgi:hypothetical protein